MSPMVGGEHFGYDKEGMKKAKAKAKKTGRKMKMTGAKKKSGRKMTGGMGY